MPVGRIAVPGVAVLNHHGIGTPCRRARLVMTGMSNAAAVPRDDGRLLRVEPLRKVREDLSFALAFPHDAQPPRNVILQEHAPERYDLVVGRGRDAVAVVLTGQLRVGNRLDVEHQMRGDGRVQKLALPGPILYRDGTTEEEEMSTEDRRAPGAARVSFDGLVEVGGTLGPSFEAQAVNVSEEGMQLRTAYLPELGQKITCRFEAGPNQSVIGSGEVVWCRGAGPGRGVRHPFHRHRRGFRRSPETRVRNERERRRRATGAKVRLYIEGLASPMRAKIRDSRPTAITVGSDLGFLQVGKHLELEDARSGSKRPASIDHVGVAVDPNSQVPQLVVTLRYSDLPPDGPVDEVAASAASDPATGSDGLAGLGDASSRMRGAFATQAGRLGPALQRWARRAKMTIALLAKRGRIEDESYPRRTTAPAPSGGLHSSGRRVVRGDEGKSSTGRRSQAPSEGERTRPLPRAVQRKAAAAGVVLLVALAGAMAMKKWHHEPAIVGSAAAPPASETPAATSATPAAPPMTPPAANPQAAAEPTPAAPLAAGTGSEATAAAPSTSAIDDGTDGSHQTAHKKHARVTPFGNASVHHGNVLRLKMDGPVESIEGAQQPTGFEVKVPGRRSLEAASPLAARDSRIASIKVNNESTGAMLTVAFKDGVPNYQVSAKGDTLVIALAPMGPLEATVAKRDDRTSKSAKHGTRTRDDSPER